MNTSQLIALAPFGMIAATVMAVMVGIAIRRSFTPICWIAASGIMASLAALRLVWRQPPIQITSLLRVDACTLFYMALLLSSGLAVLGYCYDYFREREGENEELPLLLLTALLGAGTLVGSSHFASFFLGLEILSISLFALVGYPDMQERPLEAAVKYLVLSGVSSAFLLMGMALIYAQCGALGFDDIGRYISGQSRISGMVLSGTILMVAGLGFKLSLVPFHAWTPDVYQGAPAPITALIATISKGAVLVLMLRYFIATNSHAYTPLLTLLAVVAALSILGGNLLALMQNNVKRLLAYSSIAHMGYVLVAFVAGGALLVESVTFYLLAYFITTLGAFGVVSCLSTPKVEADDMTLYRGLFWRRPWIAAVFTLMLLSLAGIPLTIGFIGKFYVFVNAADGGLWGLLLAMIVGTGLGLYYYLRIIVVMSLDAEEGADQHGASKAAWNSGAILAVLTVLLVWLGIDPGPMVDLIQSLSFALK